MENKTKITVAIIGAVAVVLAAIIGGVFAVRAAQVSNLKSDDPKLIYQRGIVYFENNEPRKAIKCFKQAAKGLDITNKDHISDRICAELFKGYAYLKITKYDKAMVCFDETLAIIKATSIFENDSTILALVYEGYGHVYGARRIFDKALDQLFKAYLFDNESERIMDNMRQTYESLNREEPFDDWLAAQLVD